jgi:hypothetical protein
LPPAREVPVLSILRVPSPLWDPFENQWEVFWDVNQLEIFLKNQIDLAKISKIKMHLDVERLSLNVYIHMVLYSNNFEITFIRQKHIF